MRVLIAGGGQVGGLIARRLTREGSEVPIVEPNAERWAQLEASVDARVVQGSASRVTAMRRAGVHDAEMLIAVTDTDEINVLACMIAQVEGRCRVKVARIRTHEYQHWGRIAAESGVKIDLIIHPETDLADRIMRVVRVPGVSDILDFAEGRVRLFGMNVDLGSRVAGKSMEELQREGPPRDSLIALIFRGQQVIIPHGAETLQPGDHAYVVATQANLHDVIGFMGLETRAPLARAFVVGGRQIGITCAERLEREGVEVKLFERDARRAERIAQILEKTVVIHGDGTDPATLQEENVAGVDAFLALTGDDEDNLIASLLARRLGVRKVVALVDRLSYLPLAQRLGVNTTVSQRLSTVDRILQFVRKGRVLSVTSFRQEEAEAIELIAAEGSKFVGRPLRELRMPRGDVAIESGDRVIFFALGNCIPELESAFIEPGRPRA